jgi:copper chaperone NosL
MKRLILTLLLLTACREDAVIPLPVAMTATSTGYFCQMEIMDHPGPKAQVHLKTYPGQPLFFSQVKDAVAYLRMPEQNDTVTATYVSDMGAAASWDDPGAMNWIAADTALYVVGSTAKGGMDAPEFVPFADTDKASAFAAAQGGQVMTLAQIPDAALTPPPTDGTDDYAGRLRALTQPGG